MDRATELVREIQAMPGVRSVIYLGNAAGVTVQAFYYPEHWEPEVTKGATAMEALLAMRDLLLARQRETFRA